MIEYEIKIKQHVDAEVSVPDGLGIRGLIPITHDDNIVTSMFIDKMEVEKQSDGTTDIIVTGYGSGYEHSGFTYETDDNKIIDLYF